ncbi:hypothetical protein D9M68_425740 [compost metagenome]
MGKVLGPPLLVLDLVPVASRLDALLAAMIFTGNARILQSLFSARDGVKLCLVLSSQFLKRSWDDVGEGAGVPRRRG